MGPGLDKTAIGAFNLGIWRFDWFCLDKGARLARPGLIKRPLALIKWPLALIKRPFAFDKMAAAC